MAFGRIRQVARAATMSSARTVAHRLAFTPRRNQHTVAAPTSAGEYSVVNAASVVLDLAMQLQNNLNKKGQHAVSDNIQQMKSQLELIERERQRLNKLQQQNPAPSASPVEESFEIEAPALR